MLNIIALDINIDNVQVRARDTELLPATEGPRTTDWSKPETLAATLVNASSDQALCLQLLTASLDLGTRPNNVGRTVVQKHIVVEGVAVRIVEYEVTNV